MHIFNDVGLTECTSNSTTHIEGLRLHPEANVYAKRLLAAADAGFRPWVG